MRDLPLTPKGGNTGSGGDRTPSKEAQAPAMVIYSNGSKWMGEESDSIEKLIERLEADILDPTFYEFGNFFYTEDGKAFWAFGNFLEVSHVFRIEGSLQEMLPLARAIAKAKRRPEYLREWAAMHRKAEALAEKGGDA